MGEQKTAQEPRSRSQLEVINAILRAEVQIVASVPIHATSDSETGRLAWLKARARDALDRADPILNGYLPDGPEVTWTFEAARDEEYRLPEAMPDLLEEERRLIAAWLRRYCPAFPRENATARALADAIEECRHHAPSFT